MSPVKVPSPRLARVGGTGRDDPAAELDRPGGAGPLSQAALFVVLAVSVWQLSRSVPTPSVRILFQSHLPVFVPASAIVFWRWGWAFLHWLRAAAYLGVKYPRLRRQARAAEARHGPVPEVAILLVTYKERAEITRRVVLSVIDELGRVRSPRRRAVIVAVTGSDADDEAIRLAYATGTAQFPSHGAPELVLLRGTEGKRDALARGLERLLDRAMDPDGVFVMMDGDTHLEPGALTRALPLFRLAPAVHAVTTNEHARVRAPAWFCEWIHLRHGLRHLYNCSISLSDRLLCLTGRYSIFRAASLDRGFIDIVRDDNVDHWLWSRYKLLSGDDKSTWFYLLAKGKRLLYAPDVSVVTHEVVSNKPFLRAYHNLRRWGGNMVRNSERAISIGPARLGPFCWWCLIDQRVSIWTTLIGPTAVAYMIARRRFDLVAAYLLWVLLSRLVRGIPAWWHGRRVSLFYAPLAVLFDWTGALVKIWVMFFPARQFWLNRGARELDSTKGAARMRDRKMVSGLLLATALLVYGLAVGQLVGAVSVTQDLAWVASDLGANPAALWTAALFVILVSALLLVRIRNGPPSRYAEGK